MNIDGVDTRRPAVIHHISELASEFSLILAVKVIVKFNVRYPRCPHIAVIYGLIAVLRIRVRSGSNCSFSRFCGSLRSGCCLYSGCSSFFSFRRGSCSRRSCGGSRRDCRRYGSFSSGRSGRYSGCRCRSGCRSCGSLSLSCCHFRHCRRHITAADS